MKSLLLLLLLVFISSCYTEPQKTKDDIWNELVPPIVVVSTGSFMSDCIVKLVDSEGTFVSLADNSACSLSPGDTIYTRKNLIN